MNYSAYLKHIKFTKTPPCYRAKYQEDYEVERKCENCVNYYNPLYRCDDQQEPCDDWERREET